MKPYYVFYDRMEAYFCHMGEGEMLDLLTNANTWEMTVNEISLYNIILVSSKPVAL